MKGLDDGPDGLSDAAFERALSGGRRRAKSAHPNKYGAYICSPCSSGDHLGVHHAGSAHASCQCSCDGIHDVNGQLKAVRL